MRKSILILFIIFQQVIYCQQYQFDNYYEYESNFGEISFIMTNSSDSTFIFKGNRNTNDITGYVFDNKKFERHHYDVSNIRNAISFKYINSKAIEGFDPQWMESKVEYNYTISKIDSLKESVKIIKYKLNRKSKSRLSEVEMIYDKNNANYFYPYLALGFFTYHFFDNRIIENTYNRLPIKISFDFYNGFRSSFNLTKKQKINTLLTISKQEINYVP